MPFLRLSRDRRGYENTYLLHTPQHGVPPRVLYWYRTAPGVRVGRPALDEDAIRTIEEQHPEVEFNWSEILAVGAVLSVDVEPQAPPRRRGGERSSGSSSGGRAPRERPSAPPAQRRAPDVVPPGPLAAMDEIPTLEAALAEPESESESVPAPRAHDLLEELVGREIATRLHARYAELSARISEVAGQDEPTREKWHARAEPLDPDLWVTPDEILSGVQRADALFDQLRRELLGNS